MNINEPIEGILISEEEKKIAPTLEIKIIEGNEELLGTQLIINAQGLVASKRNKKDGCTIIGSQDQSQTTGEHYNDFVIQNSEEFKSQLDGKSQDQAQFGGIGKRHMVIKYNEINKNYYLRDLGDGSGTFIRIDNQKDLILKHGFIVSYGESHMLV